MDSLVTDQPNPTKNDKPAVWDLVLSDLKNPLYATGFAQNVIDLVASDMKERDKIGIERYNTRLQPFNGRNALVDAYQESLDCSVYLRQAIEEGKSNLGYIYSSQIRICLHLRGALDE